MTIPQSWFSLINQNPIHAQELLNALEQNPWKTYIEVLDENGKVAIDEINNHLDPDRGIAKSVEITGIGGLGKTSVAREYMKRCINGWKDWKVNPYTYYFYYTAKGDMGEVETRYTKNDGKYGIQNSGWSKAEVCMFQNSTLTDSQQNLYLLNLKVDLEDLATYLREHPF